MLARSSYRTGLFRIMLNFMNRWRQTAPGHTVMFSPRFSLLDERPRRASRKDLIATSIDMCPQAVVMNGLLSGGECTRLIEMLEASNRFCSADALAAKNDMIIWIAPDDMMAELWERAAPAAKRYFRSSRKVPDLAPVGFNSYLRVYRYRPGQVFLTHRDRARPSAVIAADGNSYTWNNHLYSQHTMLLYLNSARDGAFTGGSTTLMPDGVEGAKIRVNPPQGGALVFPHGKHELSILHAGERVHSGVKYVIRSDVLFPA